MTHEKKKKYLVLFEKIKKKNFKIHFQFFEIFPFQ